MTDKEHARKYARESISLAISMYNPKAEDIAFFACLYGLTYKNDEIKELKQQIEKLKTDLNNAIEDANRWEETETFSVLNCIYNDNFEVITSVSN